LLISFFRLFIFSTYKCDWIFVYWFHICLLWWISFNRIFMDSLWKLSAASCHLWAKIILLLPFQFGCLFFLFLTWLLLLGLLVCWMEVVKAGVIVCSDWHTKYHKLSDLNNRHLFFHRPESRKSMINVLPLFLACR
jgi:hypothetical protein